MLDFQVTEAVILKAMEENKEAKDKADKEREREEFRRSHKKLAKGGF